MCNDDCKATVVEYERKISELKDQLRKKDRELQKKDRELQKVNFEHTILPNN